jgi:phosphohistidine phosphatase
MPKNVYELYLIRHGVAEERGSNWPDDTKRPLTERGMDRMRKAARGIARTGTTFDIVMTSPLTRARQTAEIVAGAFDPRPAIVTSDALSPGGSYSMLIADLQKSARRTRVALVGHEPGIGELAAKLIGSKTAIEFKKGAVCRIDVEGMPPAGAGMLRWFATPRLLRSLRS